MVEGLCSGLAPVEIDAPDFVPLAAPLSVADLASLERFIASNPGALVITGAGVSTESRIPDYRSPAGAYSTGFRPMTHQQFMASSAARARYWARSFAGWYRYACVKPNAGHYALAALQQQGWLGQVLTQNVDRLHQRAGAGNVLELHGSTHDVRCMGCGAISSRESLQRRLAELNPEADTAARAMANGGRGDPDRCRTESADGDAKRALVDTHSSEQAFQTDTDGGLKVPIRRPDGDVELEDAGRGFFVPGCGVCNGVLKPDVVMFGDNVPAAVAGEAMRAAEVAGAVLVVGSSLQVWSAFRLVRAAKAAGAPLALLSVGPNRADGLADLKVEARAGEALTELQRLFLGRQP